MDNRECGYKQVNLGGGDGAVESLNCVGYTKLHM